MCNSYILLNSSHRTNNEIRVSPDMKYVMIAIPKSLTPDMVEEQSIVIGETQYLRQSISPGQSPQSIHKYVALLAKVKSDAKYPKKTNEQSLPIMDHAK